ncbi:MAG: hypothetical protein HQL06_14900 [Nitrospirae bacterium]|nr:hypothetical protein [Nitrospirota bacterium]
MGWMRGVPHLHPTPACGSRDLLSTLGGVFIYSTTCEAGRSTLSLTVWKRRQEGGLTSTAVLYRKAVYG